MQPSAAQYQCNAAQLAGARQSQYNRWEPGARTGSWIYSGLGAVIWAYRGCLCVLEFSPQFSNSRGRRRWSSGTPYCFWLCFRALSEKILGRKKTGPGYPNSEPWAPRPYSVAGSSGQNRDYLVSSNNQPRAYQTGPSILPRRTIPTQNPLTLPPAKHTVATRPRGPGRVPERFSRRHGRSPPSLSHLRLLQTFAPPWTDDHIFSFNLDQLLQNV